MISRPFWKNRIEKAWEEAPIVWLCGVRRCGKTTLTTEFDENDVFYVNCDLPAAAEMTADPELFYGGCEKPILVLDEIHQLPDPSRLLKIGADMFPDLRILATGSSTLAASRKFKDTLTGRKRVVHLTPVLWEELRSFGGASLQKRLYHGGLPEPLLADRKMPSYYREWMDSFFARDIQRLFAFRNPEKFINLFEYLLKQSGGLLETTRTASALGISRPTVENHLRALATTHAVTILRPFHGGGSKELVKMPKVYGFDTGFVSFCRGWDPLRPDDFGPLWEHMVLEFLQAHFPIAALHFWRDTSGREIDFVIPFSRERIDAIECKISPDKLDGDNLAVFRKFYPSGGNYLVCPSVTTPYRRKVRNQNVLVCNPGDFLKAVTAAGPQHNEVIF